MSLSARQLPSIADARRAGVRLKASLFGRDLLEGGSARERMTAALVFRALLQVRSETPKTLDVAWDRAMKLPRTPPPPQQGFDEGTSAYIVRLHHQEPRACTFDAPRRPGVMVCSVCSGTGFVEEVRQHGRYREVVRVPCYGCRGAQAIPCTNCDGTGRGARVDLVMVIDRVVTIDEVLVPPLGDELEGRVRKALLDRVEFAPELARDIMSWEPASDARTLGPDLPTLRQRAIDLGVRQGARLATHRAFETFVVPLLVLEDGKTRGVLLRIGETTTGFVASL